MNKQLFKNLCSSFRELRRMYGTEKALRIINRYSPADVEIVKKVFSI